MDVHEPDAAWRAAVAHDLRTPLNAIKTWAHVLGAELHSASPAARRALQGILASVDRQAGLIDTLLERRPPDEGVKSRGER